MKFLKQSTSQTLVNPENSLFGKNAKVTNFKLDHSQTVPESKQENEEVKIQENGSEKESEKAPFEEMEEDHDESPPATMQDIMKLQAQIRAKKTKIKGFKISVTDNEEVAKQL